METFAIKLKDNWIFIIFFANLIVWYANIGSRLTAVEAKVLEQQTTLEKIDQLQIDVAVIKTNVDFIKKSVE